LAGRTDVFHTNDSAAWGATNTGFLPTTSSTTASNTVVVQKNIERVTFVVEKSDRVLDTETNATHMEWLGYARRLNEAPNFLLKKRWNVAQTVWYRKPRYSCKAHKDHKVGMKKTELNRLFLTEEACHFAAIESCHKEASLYNVTDGKAVGTYLEHKFQKFLEQKYNYQKGSSAEGLDFPQLLVDMKVTSIRQPQSSCPFSSARQKIYGLGYSLLLFVYQKLDDLTSKTSTLDIQHVVFIEENRTADFQMTSGLCQIIENQGNKEDLIAFMVDRNLPIDEIQADQLAEEILQKKPTIGYLTISNALQWRLQYRRALDNAGQIDGILKVR